MPIKFFTQDKNPPKFLRKQAKLWITNCIQERGYSLGEINYIFCSDEHLLEINKQYLNHNYFTDIITFNYNEDKIVNSDIYISIDRVKDNAKTFNQTTKHEFYRVLIHGILHLTGQNDKTKIEEKQMHKLEDLCLSKVVV